MIRFSPCELDQVVELQKEVHTPDGLGGTHREWVTQSKAFAKIRPLSGRERMHSDMTAAEGGYMVVIRNTGGVDVRANWRVLWQGMALNIRFPELRGPKPQYLVLNAEAGVAT